MRTIRSVLKRYLRNGDCFIDVGARNGVPATLPAADIVGPTGKVIALEDDKASHDRLCRNALHSGHGNIACLRMRAGITCSENAPQTRLDELFRSSCVRSVALVRIATRDALAVVAGLGDMVNSAAAPTLVFHQEQTLIAADMGRIQDVLEAADYDLQSTDFWTLAVPRCRGNDARLPRTRVLLPFLSLGPAQRGAACNHA